jgi:hypothetical protein
VNVSFELTYSIPESMHVTDEELSAFARVNGVFNAWPYFREFVHASVARMGLPSVIVPIYRLSGQRPAAKRAIAARPSVKVEKASSKK